MSKQDAIRTQITNKIIEAIEQGSSPWRRPWNSSGMLRNAVSKKGYRGVNVWMLSIDMMHKGFNLPVYATYRQWQGIKCQVQKGMKGTPIVFFSLLEKENDNGKVKKIPLLRTWTVFNIEQTDAPESLKAKFRPTMQEIASHDAADKLVSASGATIETGGDRACYSPSLDVIRMPQKGLFHCVESYYGTLLHELAHWTGHESRLNRDMSVRFGSDSYAMEELVAEMAGCFMSAAVGLPILESLENHASYLKNWLTVLRADNKALFTASTAAQAAADYCLKKAGMADEGQEEPTEPVEGREPPESEPCGPDCETCS